MTEAFLSWHGSRAIVLCGPHAAGKTTLLRDLEAVGFREREREVTWDHGGDDDPYQRGLRFVRGYMAHYEQVGREELPDRTVLQRSPLDQYAYATAFLRLGWLTEDQFNSAVLDTGLMRLVPAILKRYRHFIILPPERGHLEMLAGRIERNGPKWREREPGYLQEVRRSYETLGNYYSGLVHVVKASERESRVREIQQWT